VKLYLIRNAYRFLNSWFDVRLLLSGAAAYTFTAIDARVVADVAIALPISLASVDVRGSGVMNSK
jgi:hypothetical protein